MNLDLTTAFDCPALSDAIVQCGSSLTVHVHRLVLARAGPGFWTSRIRRPDAVAAGGKIVIRLERLEQERDDEIREVFRAAYTGMVSAAPGADGAAARLLRLHATSDRLGFASVSGQIRDLMAALFDAAFSLMNRDTEMDNELLLRVLALTLPDTRHHRRRDAALWALLTLQDHHHPRMHGRRAIFGLRCAEVVLAHVLPPPPPPHTKKETSDPDTVLLLSSSSSLSGSASVADGGEKIREKIPVAAVADLLELVVSASERSGPGYGAPLRRALLRRPDAASLDVCQRFRLLARADSALGDADARALLLRLPADAFRSVLRDMEADSADTLLALVDLYVNSRSQYDEELNETLAVYVRIPWLSRGLAASLLAGYIAPWFYRNRDRKLALARFLASPDPVPDVVSKRNVSFVFGPATTTDESTYEDFTHESIEEEEETREEEYDNPLVKLNFAGPYPPPPPRQQTPTVRRSSRLDPRPVLRGHALRATLTTEGEGGSNVRLEVSQTWAGSSYSVRCSDPQLQPRIGLGAFEIPPSLDLDLFEVKCEIFVPGYM